MTGQCARFTRLLCITSVGALLAGPVVAQSPKPSTVPAPTPVETQALPPVTPPTAAQAPEAKPAEPAPTPPPATAVPLPVPAPEAPPVQAAPAKPEAPVAPPATAVESPAKPGTMLSLAPPPSDPMVPDTVEMASRPALIAKGQSTWDDGYDKLKAAFAKLRAEAAKAGLKIVGYPVTLFVETDDNGFRYEALLPIEAAPPQRPAGLASDVRIGATPEGKAVRFVHKGPYDDVDSTYEAITAYLDLKGIEAKDTLIEEYLNFGKDSGDGELEVHIYVQPRK